MFIKDILAQRLKQLRIKNKLKQEDIGNLINVSKTQISDIENGKKSTSIENLVILAEYFNVSLDYLSGKSDNPNTTNEDINNFKGLFDDLNSLSEDSKKELEKYIQLLKMKDIQERNKDKMSLTSELEN